MSYKNRIIIGGAGGGGKGGTGAGATEAPNTLRSKQVAHIIDLLGEGEWEGLIDGPGGVYLNDVALFTPTSPTGDVVDMDEASSEDGTWGPAGTWNFKGVSLEFRHGTQSQPAIRSASGVSFVQSVNLSVVKVTPIVATITNPNVDTAVVNIQVSQLYQQNTSNGNITGHYVDLEIQARPSGGSWTSIKVDRIEGKAMSAYIRAYSIDLHLLSETGPWDVRVIRISDDDPDASKHSDITFLGMDLMSRDKFRYPNSVLCSVGIDASQLASIPSRAYDVKMSRVRIPSNYNPSTRAYSGVWDGTFQIAWTDNPAWCLYDMITSPRYGLGEYLDDSLTDKWALYRIGQYCDELVPNGFGGTEPRFRLNVFFQTAEEGISLIQNMASVFRGILYYLNESLTALQDAPSDAVYQFNPSNVIDGQFSYAGASGSARHTIAMVVWNNPEIQYKQDIEVVEDVAGLLRFGYRPITIQAMGCTSRGQAHRLGLWALYVEQYESDVVTFSTALEGTGIQPGNIIDIYDPTRANTSLGGRVLSVSGQTIYPDRPVVVSTGTHDVSFIADDGTMVTREWTATAGSHSSIPLNGTGAVPSVGSIYGVQTAQVMSQQFRVISITEEDAHKYTITAVAYNSSKYGYVESGLKLTERPIRASTDPQPGVSAVTFTEALYLLADGAIANRLTISWAQNPLAVGYMVSYKVGRGNWTTESLVVANETTIDSVVEGWTYSIRIAVVTLDGVRGGLVEESYVVLGEKAPPPPFDDFEYSVQSDGTHQIDFGYVSTTKPLDYLGAQVRYFAGVTIDWDEMTPLFDGFYTSSPITFNDVVPAGTYTLAIRAEDKTHSLSTPVFMLETLGSGRTPVADIATAVSRIDDIANDNILSRGEKLTNDLFWNQIVAHYTVKVSEATAAGITTEKTALIAAYDALVAYLATPYNPSTHEGVGLGGSDWSDVTTDSQIWGLTFRARFDAVFEAMQVLDTKLSEVNRVAIAGAVASINAAVTRIDTIADDNVLSKGEKWANEAFWNQIIAYYNTKVAEATAAGITTEKTAFTNAYNALATYLTTAYNSGTGQGVGAGGTDWKNPATDSQINGVIFRTKFNDVFAAAQTLDVALASTTRILASGAVSSVAAANARIDDIASDNVLTRGEKQANELLWKQIEAHYLYMDAQAATFGNTVERAALTAAYNALVTYLALPYNSGTGQGVGLGGTDWANYATDSTMLGSTFRAKFSAVFTAISNLEQALKGHAAQTAVWSEITGAGKPANNADVTKDRLENAATQILMANSELLKSTSGTAGVFIGANGVVGKDAGGLTTFALNGSTGAATFRGTITGGSDLYIEGDAKFDGSTYDPGIGGNAAIVANEATNAAVGVIAYAGAGGRAIVGQATSNRTGVQGTTESGVGVEGIAQSTGGRGVSGSTGAAGAVGVFAGNAFGGVALQVQGPMLWSGYTYSAPAGSATTVMHNDGVWRDPVTTARVNAAFGVAASGVCQLIVGDTGTANVAGSGLNLNFGTGLAGTYQVRGTGNSLILESVSDRRLKTDIRDEVRGLDTVLKLKPVSFRMAKMPEYLHHGFIAQDVAEVMTPQDEKDATVFTNPNGIMGINHIELISVLTRAVQELHAEVQKLKQRG